MKKRVYHKTFDSTMKTWNALFAEAAAFATTVGQENLISISHSDTHGRGVVTVWYWGAK